MEKSGVFNRGKGKTNPGKTSGILGEKNCRSAGAGVPYPQRMVVDLVKMAFPRREGEKKWGWRE